MATMNHTGTGGGGGYGGGGTPTTDPMNKLKLLSFLFFFQEKMCHPGRAMEGFCGLLVSLIRGATGCGEPSALIHRRPTVIGQIICETNSRQPEGQLESFFSQ